MAAHHSETLGMTLFLNKRSIRGERNMKKMSIGYRVMGMGRKVEDKGKIPFFAALIRVAGRPGKKRIGHGCTP
jgi:hypothetical protein